MSTYSIALEILLKVMWQAGWEESLGENCSAGKSSLTLCSPVDCSIPGFPILQYLPEFAQTHFHWVSDAIQPSHPLSPSFLPALNLSQHQGLFQWMGSSHHVANILELQHQASVLPMSIQGWFPLGLTDWISMQSKGLSRVFFSTIVRTWLLEKP